MTVLYGDLDLFLEADRVFNVQHVAGLVTVGVFLMDRRAVAQKSVRLHAPCLVEIVFAPGAVQVRRPLVAIDPNHVVTFAPPSSQEVGDRKVATDVMPSALGL